jgi:hypothetical protein
VAESHLTPVTSRTTGTESQLVRKVRTGRSRGSGTSRAEGGALGLRVEVEAIGVHDEEMTVDTVDGTTGLRLGGLDAAARRGSGEGGSCSHSSKLVMLTLERNLVCFQVTFS